MSEKVPQERDSSHVYLSSLSPKDKPWDKRKTENLGVKHLYQGTMYDRYADRMGNCGGRLGFKWVLDDKTGELKLKLNACRFCHCRHCPICQWRRSLMWMARFLQTLPTIVKDHPSASYLFLTLTVKNCKIGNLRETLDAMNKAWHRMVNRKQFPAIGFVRSTEVTKAADGKAHPHFHAVLMVKQSYFQGAYYLSHDDWIALWRSCLRIDYDPSVRVSAVKNRRRQAQTQKRVNIPLDSSDASETILAATERISIGIVETLKYSIKPSDMIGTGSEADRQWLIELTTQLRNTRSIALGGIFKNYLSEKDPENLIGNDLKKLDKISNIAFGYKENLARYTVLKNW